MVGAHRTHAALGVLLIGTLAGCGGGSDSPATPPPPPPPPQFTIGGSVSGLIGSLVLQNNGGANLTVNADGSFAFTPTVTSGGAYSVTVLTQSELQSCTVTAGSGTANANVTNVSIACADVAPVLSLDLVQTKIFQMQWTVGSTVTHYRLLEDPTGSAGFTQVGSDLQAPRSSFAHVVGLHHRLNARYKLQACSTARCIDSNTVAVSGSLEPAIGFFKAFNTDVADRFGSAIALSADGLTLAVSAPLEDSGLTGIAQFERDNSLPDTGAIYVYARPDVASEWERQEYIKASNTGLRDQFGSAVALSADGSTLAVGAQMEDSLDNSVINSGAVYVFVRTGSRTWTEQAYIKAEDAQDDDRFGFSVSLSADGSRLAVGAPFEDEINVDSGAVYVFGRDTAVWTEEAYIKASNAGEADGFGESVSLSASGELLAVGAPRESSSATGVDGEQSDDTAPGSGAVYTYTRDALSWTQRHYVKASNTGETDFFGSAVALSSDGSTLVVGAPGEASTTIGVNPPVNELTPEAGAAYVFRQDSNSPLTQDAFLKASNTESVNPDIFGRSVAVSADGTIIVVGAPAEDSRSSGLSSNQIDNDLPDSGAAYVFVRAADQWSQQTYVKPSNTREDSAFGTTTALSGDGQTLAVGAIFEPSSGTGVNTVQENVLAPESGAVYVY